ncbi:MAG: hypothetical protein ACU83V_14650, partial [Gammaproteobacteria bacterium]
VFFVSLTPDETRAVSAGKDKRILEWDLNAPLPLFREYMLAEENIQEVVFSSCQYRGRQRAARVPMDYHPLTASGASLDKKR